MALDALRCNHLAPLGFKGLTAAEITLNVPVNGPTCQSKNEEVDKTSKSALTTAETISLAFMQLTGFGLRP